MRDESHSFNQTVTVTLTTFSAALQTASVIVWPHVCRSGSKTCQASRLITNPWQLGSSKALLSVCLAVSRRWQCKPANSILSKAVVVTTTRLTLQLGTNLNVQVAIRQAGDIWW